MLKNDPVRGQTDFIVEKKHTNILEEGILAI